MRKLAFIMITLLVPFAVWISGCRQNDTAAAFPKGPEVKGLARARTPGERTALQPPVIPAAVDPEILAAPDQPTYARIRAVMDREAALSSRYAEPGLFVLPRQDVPELAVAQEPARAANMYVEPLPAMARGPGFEPLPEPVAIDMPVMAQTRQPSRPEFWSRPVAPPPAYGTGMLPAPADVSAMAPPAAYQGGRTPEPLFLPEAVPGIYMGQGDAGAFVDTGPISSAGRPDAIGPFGEAAVSPFGPDAGYAPATLAVSGHGMIDTNAIPLVATFAPSAFSGQPPTGSKAADIFKRLDENTALAPLAPLAEAAPIAPPLRTAELRLDDMTKAAPSPFVASVQKPTADKAAGTDVPAGFMPPPPSERLSMPETPSRDMYMMDFWETRSAAPSFSEAKRDAPESVEPAPEELATVVSAVEALENKASDADPFGRIEEPAAPAKVDADTTPRKVVLTPAKDRPRFRSAELNRIDSMVEPPPLRY